MAVVFVVGAEGDVVVSNLLSAKFKIVIGGPWSAFSGTQEVKVVDLDLLGDEKSTERAVSNAWDAFGGVDCLVFCANYQGTLTPALEITEQEWDTTVHRNLKAAWLVSKAVAKRMREAGNGGSIVFLTSIMSSDRGIFPGTSVYGTSLAGIHHLSKALALEVGKYKIRVNSIMRGLCESDTVLRLRNGEIALESSSKLLPMQRWMDVSKDLASMLVFFARGDSPFITGITIYVDGGQSLVRPRLRSRF